MTLVDVCIAPILWRLNLLGISLDGKKAKPIMEYANRLFEKEGFHESLTFAEKDFN
jgi:RNA polymerase-associated protein